MHQQAGVERLQVDAAACDDRGRPYAVARALIRQLISRAHVAAPELVRAHQLTLLSVVPELADHVPVSDEVVRSFAFSREGNSRSFTRRIAHGLTEFLLGFIARVASDEGDAKDVRGAKDARCTVSFANVHDADPTDLEFIAILSKRAAPDRLKVLVEAPSSSGAALTPERAAESPDSLLSSAEQAMRMAYYDFALDCATRGRRALESQSQTQSKEYGELTRHALFALLLLGRFTEVEELCASVRATRRDGAILAHAAYAMAILNVRLYEPARRDYDAATAWIDASRGFTEQLPSSESRTVNLAFLQNTKALVEMRRGHPHVAIELLTEALDVLARESPDSFAIECSILFHNRARVHVALGDLESALKDFTTLLGHEPSCSAAYFDRAAVHQRSGKLELAIADYDSAIAWSPPYAEPHLNRAQLLTTLGRVDEALAEYNYVLTLEPELPEALVSRAWLLFERGDFGAAQADADRAADLGPRAARLGCLHGLLQVRRGDLAAAERSFTDAMEIDPMLADAWANRATVFFKRGERQAALSDLTLALTLREDPTILVNRGRVFEALERWEDAVVDYSRALALLDAAPPHVVRRRDRCLERLA